MSTPEPQTTNRRILAELIANAQWTPSRVNTFKAAACMADATDHSNGLSVKPGEAENAGSATVGDKAYTIDDISEQKFRELVEKAIDKQVDPDKKERVRSAVLERHRSPEITEALPAEASNNGTASTTNSGLSAGQPAQPSSGLNNDTSNQSGGGPPIDLTHSSVDGPRILPLPPVTTGLPSTSTSRKRGPDLMAGSEANDLHLLDDIDIPDGTHMESCDVVRRKIRTFIEAGAMKVGEFCDEIGGSNKSYNNFLQQHGTHKGVDTATYQNAWEFFKKREMAGLKMPKKPKLQDKNGKTKEDVSPNLSDVHLPGEDEDAVEIYDTCADVRKKITAYLKRPGVTQAQFCRDLLAQFHTSRGPSRIQSNQLNSFRGKKGVDGGNTSSVFYAAYVFFEKLRIKEGKGKGKHRQEMEQIYAGQGGFDTRTAVKRITASIHDGVGMDSYGRMYTY